MLKRYKPTSTNGSTSLYNLPQSYSGGDITLFVNGQLLDTIDDINHPYGFTLDEINKQFSFFTPPLPDDFIYIIYDDSGVSSGINTSSDVGLLKLSKGFSLISYPGSIKAIWSKDSHKVLYPANVLANVKNLIIDQIEDRYGVPASSLIREIQTYRDDTGEYRTFIPGSTGVAWTNNGEHVSTPSLFREAGELDYGDEKVNNYVYYNPNNFILANCILGDDSATVISNDIQNPISSLPMGQRSGILIYVFPDADLSLTNELLEIYF